MTLIMRFSDHGDVVEIVPALCVACQEEEGGEERETMLLVAQKIAKSYLPAYLLVSFEYLRS